MEKLDQQLQEVYGNRKWIISSQAAAATPKLVEMLATWGSESIVVAATEGTGDLPDTDVVYTRSESDSAVGAIRAFFQSVESPDPEIQEAVDRFDPDGTARVIAEPYATAQHMVGRKTFGVRRPEWSAWEDKMRADQLWEDLSIPHAPYLIVDVADAPQAASQMATDIGSVWVADNSRGWHGGGDFVKWVPSPDSFDETVEWFSSRADRVRVMPFLEGLPCSIHGWTTADGVATFLPVEILVLRGEPGSHLVHTGVATLWNPSSDVTDELRSVANRVGAELNRRVGYLGPYGIDGVLTSDGFRPTELNPRMSVGAGVQLVGVDVPLGLVMRAEIEILIEVDHKWLEEKALAEREPHIHFGRTVGVEVRDSFLVGYSESGAVVGVESADDSIGEITAGPSSTGSFVTGKFETEKLEQGPPVGQLIAAILNLASEKWALGLPELTSAPPPSG